MNLLLEAALGYAARGWRVVALHTPILTEPAPACSCRKGVSCKHKGKHPRYDAETLAHAANSGTTDAATIRRWWGLWPDANVGIVTGMESGIAAIDIDPRNGGTESLEELESELGKLPVTVEALTGGGGLHKAFVHPGGKLRGKPKPGIEVLGDGQLFVAEPSLHVSGKSYTWELSSTPENCKLAELPESWRIWLQIQSGDTGNRGYRESGENREDREHKDPLTTVVIPAIPVRVDDPQWTIDRVFRETLPSGPGQHDQLTMDFARAVKLNLGIATAEEAQPIFDRWYELARPFINEQDYDTAWFKFLRAFDAARVPFGKANFAASALAAAKAGPLPKIADKVRSERMRLLIGMCRELARMMGGTFRLSCHQIADLFDVEPQQAWEWLRGLERIGALRCEDRGKSGRPGRNAATFTYLGD
jgi:hypothetical protein